MQNQKFGRFGRSAVIASGLLAAAGASQAMDTGAVTAAIAEAATAGAAIGGAVLVMIVAIKVFKWVRGAM